MTKLSYRNLRIRAGSRILKTEYWRLRKAIREHLDDVAFHDSIQDRINYFEECLELLDISL